MHRSLKIDAAKNGKVEMNIFKNGPEMAQKLHFFNLSSNFSHGHWWDSGKIFPILSAQNVGALEKILCTQEIELSRLKIGTNSFYRLWKTFHSL